MTNKPRQQKPATIQGEDVYTEVISLCKKQLTEMLVRTIDSAADYHNWDLPEQKAAGLAKLLKHKQRIICSSFSFKLNQHFSDFKTGDGTQTREQGRHDWSGIGLDKENNSAEIELLEDITTRYAEAFKEFDRTLLKRLQTCIRRSRANIYENPLQVKRLCESFYHAIDGLELKSIKLRMALYQLFSERFIESLGPLYRSIDLFLLDHGMQTGIAAARIQLRSIDGLSESEAPAALQLDQQACLLMLLQDFKEKSRVSANRLRNYFPELKEQFAQHGIKQHDDQIDQLNLMFKLIFEDEDLPMPIKQQLARLQIYIFITAIQEDGFLRRSTNPARRLLDGITSSEVEFARKSGSDFSGIQFIREQMDEMAALQFITVDHYSNMLEGYQQFIEENEAGIRRKRKTEAMRKLLPLVKERLAEITQPLRIQGTPMILFEKVWLPLLVQIALQRGMDSEPWHKTITMVKTQVWSLIPKADAEEHAELLKVLPVVAHATNRAMRSLKLAEPVQQSLRDFLKLEQQNVAEQSARNIIDAKRKTRSLSAQSFAPSSEEDTTEFDALMQTGMFKVASDSLVASNPVKSKPLKTNQLGALSVGGWVNYQQADGIKLVKLAWKAEDSSLFIFVDRDGKRVCEIDASSLSEKFESGEISLGDASVSDTEKVRTSFMTSL